MNLNNSQWLVRDFLLQMDQSPTLRINQRSRELESEGKKIFRLGLGQSPFPVPPPVVDALRLYAAEKDYLPVQGLMQLRQAVARYHNNKDGVDIYPANVIIGPGSKELLFLLQLVFDGIVIIPSPSWVSYVPQARILGKELLILNTSLDNDWRIEADELEALCKANNTGKPFLLILNYPGNPDGITYTDTQLENIAAVTRRNQVYILSDEIYGRLHHDGLHISMARFYPEGTIISSGLSKWAGAGGWRLGTFSFPPQLRALLEAMSVVASETYTSVSAPIQYAAVQAFAGKAEIESYLWHVRKVLKALGTRIATDFRKAGLRLTLPTGGFYLFMDFENFREKLTARNIDGSVALCDALLNECGIAVLPGKDFSRPAEELTMRLSYVDFDGDRALAASYMHPLHKDLPEDFLERYCPKVIEATRVLIEWLKKL